MKTELRSITPTKILDNLNEGIIVAEDQGSIHYTNTAALELLGKSEVPSTLGMAVAPFDAWQELLRDGAISYLYTSAGRIEVQARLSNWQGDPAWFLSLNRSWPRQANDDISSSLSEQLSALTRISDLLSTTLRLSDILQAIAHEATAVCAANGCAILLSDHLQDGQEQKFISGDEFSASILTDLQLQAEQTHSPILVDDLPRNSSLKSLLLSPILYANQLAGIILLSSSRTNHFDEKAQTFVKTLANIAAVAIGNAQRFEELNVRNRQLHRRARQIERFVSSSGASQGEKSLMEVHEDLVYTVQEGVGFRVAILYLVANEISECTVRVSAAAGLPVDELNELKQIRLDWRKFKKTLSTGLRIGQAYFIPSGLARQSLPAGVWLEQSVNKIQAQDTKLLRWQPGDFFIIPFENTDEQTIGYFQLASPEDDRRPDEDTAEILEIFANHAATSIQNATLVADLRELNEELDLRVAERTGALGEERDRVQYLLRVTVELAATLDQDRVLSRALELVNEVVDATHGGIMMVDTESRGLVFPSIIGTPIPSPVEEGGLGRESSESLARRIIKNRSQIVINDTLADESWSLLLGKSGFRSVLAVPLISGDEVNGVLMLFHKAPDAFSEEQLELVAAAAIQVGSALANAQLYLLIRDQAERLGSMLREEHLEAAKNQSILESIADGVLFADTSGTVILGNLSACQILEIPQSQLIENSIIELVAKYSDSAVTWKNTIQEWESKGHNENDRPSLADRLMVNDKIVSIHLSPVFSGNQFSGTVSILRDVTKEVEVDRMKSEFVSTVSHELRTPMTSIKGYTELMLMGVLGELSDVHMSYLQVIQQNANRMTSLVNDLLDISRIESGKIELELRGFDITDVINQAIEIHLPGRIEHENKHVYVSKKIESNLPPVYADEDRVSQVLTNLLDNAFHYTSESGNIRVSASSNGSFVKVSVSDNGIGISKENQEKIFERFYRSDNEDVQKVAGTGLGLSIVRSLVQLHGGQITVDSMLGKGSTFTFSLPLAELES
jgi:signal transduction histidine kinase